MEFGEFRKEIGLSSAELEKITGYTRQGMRLLFKRIEEGKALNKKSLFCINEAIKKKMDEETKAYENKINKLRELQEKFKENDQCLSKRELFPSHVSNQFIKSDGKDIKLDELILKGMRNKDISKVQLAECVGCTSRAIDYWINGEREISLGNADKLFKALDINICIGGATNGKRI